MKKIPFLFIAMFLIGRCTTLVVSAQDEEVILGNPSNFVITSAGNQILELQWSPGDVVGITPECVRYLIYRSTSEKWEL